MPLLDLHLLDKVFVHCSTSKRNVLHVGLIWCVLTVYVAIDLQLLKVTENVLFKVFPLLRKSLLTSKLFKNVDLDGTRLGLLHRCVSLLALIIIVFLLAVQLQDALLLLFINLAHHRVAGQ